MLCNVMLCCAMLCYVMSCYVMSSQVRSNYSMVCFFGSRVWLVNDKINISVIKCGIKSKINDL